MTNNETTKKTENRPAFPKRGASNRRFSIFVPRRKRRKEFLLDEEGVIGSPWLRKKRTMLGRLEMSVAFVVFWLIGVRYNALRKLAQWKTNKPKPTEIYDK